MLRCIPCGAIFPDSWETDAENTVFLPQPVCPYCDRGYYEETDRPPTPPTRPIRRRGDTDNSLSTDWRNYLRARNTIDLGDTTGLDKYLESAKNCKEPDMNRLRNQVADTILKEKDREQQTALDLMDSPHKSSAEYVFGVRDQIQRARDLWATEPPRDLSLLDAVDLQYPEPTPREYDRVKVKLHRFRQQLRGTDYGTF